MNASVTATGMKIQATTGGNLLIARGTGTNNAEKPEDSVFATSVDLSSYYTNTKILYAVSTTNLTTWNTSTADAANSKVTNGTYTTVTAGDTNYMLRENLWLLSTEKNTDVKLSSVTIKGLDMGVNAGNSNGHFADCLRIGISMGETTTIYAPCAYTANGTETSQTNTTAVGYSGTTVAPLSNFVPMTFDANGTSTTGYTSTYSGSTVCGNLSQGTAKVAVVYIWFEGEDFACYTNNANLNNVTIDITFTGTGATTTNP